MRVDGVPGAPQLGREEGEEQAKETNEQSLGRQEENQVA